MSSPWIQCRLLGAVVALGPGYKEAPHGAGRARFPDATSRLLNCTDPSQDPGNVLKWLYVVNFEKTNKQTNIFLYFFVTETKMTWYKFHGPQNLDLPLTRSRGSFLEGGGTRLDLDEDGHGGVGANQGGALAPGRGVPSPGCSVCKAPVVRAPGWLRDLRSAPFHCVGSQMATRSEAPEVSGAGW